MTLDLDEFLAYERGMWAVGDELERQRRRAARGEG
jgi:hypothetical protein